MRVSVTVTQDHLQRDDGTASGNAVSLAIAEVLGIEEVLGLTAEGAEASVGYEMPWFTRGIRVLIDWETPPMELPPEADEFLHALFTGEGEVRVPLTFHIERPDAP